MEQLCPVNRTSDLAWLYEKYYNPIQRYAKIEIGYIMTKYRHDDDVKLSYNLGELVIVSLLSWCDWCGCVCVYVL